MTVNKKPLTMRTKSGWVVVVYYNGSVLIKNERGKILSIHSEGCTQEAVIEKYKNDGWEVIL